MKKVSNINIVREFPLPTPREILAELPLTTEITEHIYAQMSSQVNSIKHLEKR